MTDLYTNLDMFMRIKKKHGKQYQYQTPVGWLMLAAALLIVFLSQKITQSLGNDSKKVVQGIMLAIGVILLIASVEVDKSLAK